MHTFCPRCPPGIVRLHLRGAGQPEGIRKYWQAEPSAKTGWETDLRYLTRDRRIAFYRIVDFSVAVIRTLDGRMDYMKILVKEK